jgi:hypothetical protein
VCQKHRERGTERRRARNRERQRRGQDRDWEEGEGGREKENEKCLLVFAVAVLGHTASTAGEHGLVFFALVDAIYLNCWVSH